MRNNNPYTHGVLKKSTVTKPAVSSRVVLKSIKSENVSNSRKDAHQVVASSIFSTKSIKTLKFLMKKKKQTQKFTPLGVM
jgi:hypothetical protein